MQPLDRQLRQQLEDTVEEAREVAEAGAKAAIGQLGVGAKAAFSHLSDQEKDLRRKLRIHGKQLGDKRDSKSTNPTVGEQETGNLVEEIAYEHWHRMLFARFLAENNLLMYPDEHDPVPVTLEECEDLAEDEGAANGWELASRFAAEMLPQIFRTDSPVFELTLPPEHQQKLERLLVELPQDVFHASDALGWVYQFWQAKRKKEVNESEVKIGARELPAVTQLFTEPYMVAFLLDNTLGAWWAGKRLSEADLANAESEEDLRQKASLPGAPLEYLRFVRGNDGEDGPWRPVAGTFDGWPEQMSELKVLDPCCGSGHFLVAAFHMLVPMRMEIDGLSEQEAVDAVLAENLHGLEIDKRCTEIAAFALAQAAWIRTGYRPLPELQIACTGLAPRASAEEWIELAEKSGVPISAIEREPVKRGLQHMHELFSQAPTLGSLIDPTALPSEGFAANFETLKPYLTAVLDREDADDEAKERAIAAAGMIKAADLLAGEYTLVITNVPYLGRRDQGDSLRCYFDTRHRAAKSDLATVFLDRSVAWLSTHATVAVILPQNTLFLSSFSEFRTVMLRDFSWNVVARLGEHAFESSAAAGAFPAMLVVSRVRPKDKHEFLGVDVSAPRGQPPIYTQEKAAMLRGSCPADLKEVRQQRQLQNPGAAITFESAAVDQRLSDYASAYQGAGLGDIEQYRDLFWEIDDFRARWDLHISSPTGETPFTGMHFICRRRDEQGNIDQSPLATIRGTKIWGKYGVACAWLGKLPCSIYLGTIFDNSAAVIVPHDPTFLLPIWAFMSVPEFNHEVRKINQKTQVANATLVNVPFDLEHWQQVASEKYPGGLPAPESDDPTQWLFHGRPEESTDPLQVAVARLLGYRWPAELDDEVELSDRARELVERCEELLPLADKDGIVCIPPIGGEASAADRLHNLLARGYGDAWSSAKLNELLKQADYGGKSLDSWLRDKFFTQHCQLFQQRPFIWHIWDGLRDGFSVLVNYHRLDHKNLQTLIYTYLGDWISRQKQDRDNNVDGAQEKLDAAEALRKRLELILEGEDPYDIFVRWKPIEEQPVGWEPDLNDGVRLNIRPFMMVPDVKKKDAGVLRDKPNINWKKDRGKDVESAPWYYLGPEYGGKEGDRINEHHLTLKEKEAAREALKETV